MSDNPYTPPGAPVRDTGEQRGSTWRALSLGVLTDIGGTFVAGIVLAILLPGFGAPEQGKAEGQVVVQTADTGYLLLSLLVGLGFTALGGYVAARVANYREYYHALLVGLASLVIGELMLSLSPEGYPLGLRLAGDLLVIPAALVGGHLRKSARATA